MSCTAKTIERASASSGWKARGRAGRPPSPSRSLARASASRRAVWPSTIRSARRRRFSTSTIRSAVGTAQSSPMVRGAARWNARTKRWRAVVVDVTIGVGDEGPGQAENPRVALQGTLGQLGELAVEPVREVLADRPERVVHHVKVVEKPLGGGGERADLADHRGDRAIALEEHTSAVAHARREGTAAPALGQEALGGEVLGVLLQPLGTEQFRADRIPRIGLERRRGGRPAHLPDRPQARHVDILYFLYKLWFDESAIRAAAGGGGHGAIPAWPEEATTHGTVRAVSSRTAGGRAAILQ